MDNAGSKNSVPASVSGEQSPAPQKKFPIRGNRETRKDFFHREAAMTRKKKKRLFWIGVIIVGGILLGWVGVRAIRRGAADLPGKFYPSQGQEHIALKAEPPKPYNSNPPSSGGHYASPANWGIYDYEVNDKIFIHNLEHGGIWIAYRPAVSPKIVEELKSLVNELGGSKIVMAPRSANDADIAVAAWSRVLKIDSAGEVLSAPQKEEIHTFYRRFKNRGPEFVPDTMPGIDPKSVQ
jgi:hypothetical protein